MISKNEMKQIRSLSQKKFRDGTGLFVVEGEKMVEEALRSGFEVVKVYREEEIGSEAMSRITLLTSPSPALAIVRKREVKSEMDGLILALDALRDPGNVGTILRIADWFGIRTILASHDTVDIYNPKVVQATMGAIFRVNVKYCDLPAELRKASSEGIQIFGTFLEGENIYRTQLPGSGIIVMGSESFGISPAVAECVTKKLTIPSFAGEGPTSESLNVAIATAIVCNEFRRK